MFQGLQTAHVMEVLKTIEPRVFTPKQVVCESGSKSTEMYILLTGQLAVQTRDGMLLATIDPIVTVGEMGIITGLQRTATVVAITQSNTLVLSKLKFDLYLKKWPDAGLIIFKNLIGTLTDRISENNRQIADFKRKFDSLKQAESSETPQRSDPEEQSSEAEQESVGSVPEMGSVSSVPKMESMESEGKGAEDKPEQAEA